MYGLASFWYTTCKINLRDLASSLDQSQHIESNSVDSGEFERPRVFETKL